MDPMDIISLSLCSSRTRKTIENHQLKASHCNLVMRTSFDKKVAVEIFITEHLKITWTIKEEETLLVESKGYKFLGNLKAGIVFYVSPTNAISTYTPEPSACIQTIANFLLSIFPCPVKNVEVEMNFFSNLELFVSWNAAKKCENLTLRASKTTHKHCLEYVLDNVDVKKSLRILKYNSRKELDCMKMKNLDEVYLNESFWLSAESFLALKCKKIALGEVKFSAKVLNQVIHRWMRMEDEKLESLVVVLEELTYARMFDISSNLKIESWDPKRRSRYFRKDALHVYDCEMGLDIYRSDGKIATVLFADHSFNLFIWHQTKQDLSLPRGMYYVQRPRQPILDAKYWSPKVYRSERQAALDLPVDVSDKPKV